MATQNNIKAINDNIFAAEQLDELGNGVMDNSNEVDVDESETVEEIDPIMESRQRTALEDLMPVLATIGADQIIPLAIPVHALVQDAQTLSTWCQPDEETLKAAGLDWDIALELPLRAMAVKEAQSRWMLVRYTRDEAQRNWLNESKESFALRDELIHFMRYAFRNDPALLAQVNRINEGHKNVDMIQDLNDLALLGVNNSELLTTVGLQRQKLSEAANRSYELSVLKAEAMVGQSKAQQQKLIRDQAYTHLKNAVDAIRQCGQFAFWKHPERIKGYTNTYFKTNRKRKRSAAVQNTIETETTPSLTRTETLAAVNS